MIGLGPGAGPLHVVCLGAHPDDVEIGCGATLLTLARRPDTTVTGIVVTGDPSRAAEARDALPAFVPGATVHTHDLADGRLPAQWLQVKELLEEHARALRPDVVLAPRVDDAHQDHRVVGSLASTVWRDALILHYEIPKWDGDLGAPSVYVGVDAETAATKWRLLDKVYASQRGRDWWDEEVFLGLMRVRGMECRSPYAEAFYTKKVSLRLAEPPAGEPVPS